MALTGWFRPSLRYQAAGGAERHQLTAVQTLVAGLHVEELEFRADDGPDGWVPLRIVSLPPGGSGETRRRPVVIFLHATGEWHIVDGVTADA